MSQLNKIKRVSIKEGYRNNPNYNQYWLEKQKISEKYPKWLYRSREQQKEYMKEIGDLMFQPNGSFQQFIWENMSDDDKLQMERRARGRKPNSNPDYEGE